MIIEGLFLAQVDHELGGGGDGGGGGYLDPHSHSIPPTDVSIFDRGDQGFGGPVPTIAFDSQPVHCYPEGLTMFNHGDSV